jgi:hypothetical protein
MISMQALYMAIRSLWLTKLEISVARTNLYLAQNISFAVTAKRQNSISSSCFDRAIEKSKLCLSLSNTRRAASPP